MHIDKNDYCKLWLNNLIEVRKCNKAGDIGEEEALLEFCGCTCVFSHPEYILAQNSEGHDEVTISSKL